MRWLFLIAIFTGCAARSDRIDPERGDVIFLVPGVGGASLEYQALIDGLHEARVGRPVHIVGWGAPRMLFFLNFNNKGIHDAAERSLADRITKWRAAHPTARIDIIAHSAGSGVTLGALGRLSRDVEIDNMVLLAPSVSPGYQLEPAVARLTGYLRVFVSDRDRTFLEWRTSTFGTYDGVRVPAAGNRGFVSLPSRVVQHPYDPKWQRLGHDGEHFGCLARLFARDIIAPLIYSPSSPAPVQSSAANPH